MNIIAIGGGSLKKQQTFPIDGHIVRLTGTKTPRALFIPRASADDQKYCEAFDRVYGGALGCRTGHLLLYRRTREEMPAIAAEVEDALGEGVEIEYHGAPVEIVRENGLLVGVVIRRMKLGEPDRSGRRAPVDKERLNIIPGIVCDLINLPVGCKFAPRCKARIEHGLEICNHREPNLIEVSPNHKVRCWLYEDPDQLIDQSQKLSQAPV